MTTVIGKPVTHIEGANKVSGRLRYTADLTPPGTLWGKCLRSPHPHARIIRIDASRARQVPGVQAVITARDLPDVLTGRAILDCPVLARDKVRFVGEKVAAVAADSVDAALQALDLIAVEYDPLPAVFDPLDAIAPDAPRVHEDPGAYRLAPDPFLAVATEPAAQPNVSSRVMSRRGDLEAGFVQADHIFEHSFTIPPVHPGYLEPHSCLVQIEPAGKIDVWSNNKTPFPIRTYMSRALGLPEAQFRVHVMPIGGDFGGKGSLMDILVAYHLARKSGRPVKMVMTYAEDLLATNPRHGLAITLRTGVTQDGRITARRARLVYNNGAYAAFRRSLTLPNNRAAVSSYRIPNMELEALCVYTNTVPRGYMRAPGGPQVVFATESHTDMIAHELSMDPVEFRRRNVLQEGDESPTGLRWEDIRAQEVLEAAAMAIGWGAPAPPNVGRGIALFNKEPRPWPSEATCRMEADGRVTLITAVPDTGTGSYTVMQQIVAEELGVPLAQVAVVTGDTDTAPYDAGIGASRVTHTAGQAALAAARLVKQALSSGQRSPIEATGSYSGDEGPGATSFCVQTAEVHVDPETGQVIVRRLVSAHDVGAILNPLTHQGQIDGGVVQGLGQAIMEHLEMADGGVSTLHLGDYKLPSIADVPPLETALVQATAGELPYHGKHIGELSNVPIPAAVANAVFNAVGVRLMDLPVTAEKVYAALHRANEEGLEASKNQK